jgi:hypothetical protein
MKTETLEVILEDVRLSLEFTVSGKYIPATHYDEAEYPDFEILKVTVWDSVVNLLPILQSNENELYELLQENYEG